MHRPHHLIAVLALGLALVGCGGGGGSSGSGTSAGPTGDGPGQRAVPGYVLSAETKSATIAGAPLTVRVSIAPQSGAQAITGVQVWIGTNDYADPASTTPATQVAGQANTWDVTTILPNPLPGDATIWLRLTTADGSIIEVGQDAFQLATLPTG